MKTLLAVAVVVLYAGLPDVTNAQLPGLPLDCPIGWKKNFRNNMCYWFNNNDFVPQYKAGQKCGNRGGHLVTINDADENNFIAANYEINPNNTVQSEHAWIGLYEQWEGKWVWEHDRSDLTYAAWAAGQPDDDRGEDYATIQAKTGEWYDMRSNQDYGYICEKEIVPDTSPKPPRTIRPPATTKPQPIPTQPQPRPTTQPQPPPTTKPQPPPTTKPQPPPTTKPQPPPTTKPQPPPTTFRPRPPTTVAPPLPSAGP